jgi:hypothetical protein
MRDFDGDITKLAGHRKFHSGGIVKREGPFTPVGGEIEHIIPHSAVAKLKSAAERFDRDGPTLEVKVEVKDAVTSVLSGVARHLIEKAIFGMLEVGQFGFMFLPQPQRLVIIESPFGHPTKVGMEENAAYARRCMLDSLKRNEAPYASHLLYTQCLDDLKVSERKQGMEAGFAWGRVAQHVAVYTDRGVSKGMLEGIKRHQANGKTIEFRSIS